MILNEEYLPRLMRLLQVDYNNPELVFELSEIKFVLMFMPRILFACKDLGVKIQDTHHISHRTTFE